MPERGEVTDDDESMFMDPVDMTPAQQAVADQNVAAASEAADKLVEMLRWHIALHDCPGPWCVSQQFGDGVTALDPSQLMILVTLMARRLAQSPVDQELHPDIPSS